MARLTSLCIFCGSRSGKDEVHRAAAARLGTLLGERGVRMVFGGGRIGLMGVAADAALAAGGKVVGVIPGHLHERELGHDGVSELVVVDSMHARKEKMFDLADAFAVLAGGLGTLDEAIEIITWKQLGLHQKPIVLVDCNGYWRPFRELIENAVAGHFAAPEARQLFTVVSRVEDIFEVIAAAPEPGPASAGEGL